ncbi:MAG: hypothetical protein DRN19_05885 [Thermoplasmata archaeon]|nr:MAG: hypothetical protein DRN19_05885 [Thermoplasmata archaeon]
MQDKLVERSDGGHGEDNASNLPTLVESRDKGHGSDGVSEIDRYWDSLRLSLFAIIFGSALTFGLSIGLAFSWWLGLLSFLTTFVAIFLLLKCKHPRNFIIKLMEPLIKPPRN